MKAYAMTDNKTMIMIFVVVDHGSDLSRADHIAQQLDLLDKVSACHQAAVIQIAMNKDYADLPMPDLFQETFLND